MDAGEPSLGRHVVWMPVSNFERQRSRYDREPTRPVAKNAQVDDDSGKTGLVIEVRTGGWRVVPVEGAAQCRGRDVARSPSDEC